MPRAYHHPVRHHLTNEVGHWESTIHDGRVVDVWVPHCESHPHTIPPCEHCNHLSTDAEGAEA